MKQETATVSQVEDCNLLSSATRRIASFVVLDLETNDLPHVFSKIAITELCMYGFAASELVTGEVTPMSNECGSPLPKRPRILHKLTLLFNPRRHIHPSAENITGLSNYSLEKETHFDENAGIAVINFIKHMQQPVCLVAHNGDVFDFPVIKQSLQKLNMEMPEGTLCLDSLRAFWGIDEQLPLEPLYSVDASASNHCQPNPGTDTLPILDFDVPDKAHGTLDSKQLPLEASSSVYASISNDCQPNTDTDTLPILDFDVPDEAHSTLYSKQLPLEASSSVDASTSNDGQPKPETDNLPILDFDVPDEAHGTLDSKQSLEVQLNIDEKVNWQVLNEKTPKRSIVAGAKKRPSSDETTPKKILSNGNDIFKSKRALFTSKPNGKYPPKGVYKLGNLYERHFKEQPKEVHYAEADVESLMNLMKVYGINFLAFAENHAILLKDIKIRR